jgi:threonine synthase
VSDPVSVLVCSGCDHALPAEEFLTFSCPNRGKDDTDHVLAAQIPSASLTEGWPTIPLQPGDNPFVRYRHLSHSYQLARRNGMGDATYLDLVSELASAIEEVDGHGPEVTPLLFCEELKTFVKNETINVSGSHKARHLIGTALHLKLAEQLGKGPDSEPTLAIASCGNAALAAAVVARAIRYKLQVFVPPWADAAVTQRLEALGAEQVVCERRDEDPPGDPCYHQFRAAVRAGALPFSCQGGDNALSSPFPVFTRCRPTMPTRWPAPGTS